MGRYALPALFTSLTLIFAVIAIAAAGHGRWVIAVASAGIGAWMASFAWSSLRRIHR